MFRGMIRDMKVIVENHEVDIPRKVCFLRTAEGMTQKELAKRLGVTTSCVCSWEKGRSKPSDGMVHKICKIFHVPVSEFVTGVYSQYGMG